MQQITLNNGVKIPQIGFGTFRTTDADGYRIVLDAIRAGYRHLDTAAVYENEEDVGRAVKESGLPRSDFFITSKLDRNHLGYESAKRELDISLKKLQTDYLDLYLIHWPRADFGRPEFDDWRRLDTESWQAMEEAVAEGKIRAIGVSNFLPEHLEHLMAGASIRPAVNQLELHPGYLQEEAVSYCREKGITPEAWSPMGRARVLHHPVLMKLAEKYGVSTARLCLAFGLQSDWILIPKSTHIERMKENLCPDDLVISDEDMAEIRAIPQVGWSGQHPDRKNIDPDHSAA